jgi:hypothetical protein
MGQAQEPISAITQSLSVNVSAISDGFGKATFTFQSPPAGVTWTGTLSCPNTTTATRFTVTVGGLIWGQFSGGSVFGPVQFVGQGSQQMVVTGIFLSPDTTYVMTLQGSSDQSVNVQPIWPDGATSIVTATLANVAEPLFASGAGTTINPGDSFLAFNHTGFDNSYSGLLVNVGTGDALPGRVIQVSTYLENYNAAGTLVNTQFLVSTIGATVAPAFTHSVYFPVTFNGNDSVQVQVVLISGPAMPASVTGSGFTQSANTFVSNPPRQTLAVSNFSGTLRKYMTGTLTTVKTLLPDLSTDPAYANDYAYRLHSVATTGLAAATVSMTYTTGDYAGQVWYRTNGNSYPNWTDLNGMLVNTGIGFFGSAATPAATVGVVYDIVPNVTVGTFHS